jgi:signal recognition particle subunit SRP54
MPGMPGVHTGKRAKGKQSAPKKAKSKRVSGNPAKRAAAEKAAAQRPSGGDGNGVNPFGLPSGPADDFDPSSVELPADLSKYLK